MAYSLLSTARRFLPGEGTPAGRVRFRFAAQCRGIAVNGGPTREVVVQDGEVSRKDAKARRKQCLLRAFASFAETAFLSPLDKYSERANHVPYVSGHALFLTYCALTSRSRVARLTAAAVMLQVIYLKYVVWHDWVSSTGGIVLGVAAAFIRRRRAPLSRGLQFTPSKTMNHHTPLTFTGRVRSFGCALAGIRVMVASQHNAWIHALATALVITVGLHFGLGRAEWCWVILAMSPSGRPSPQQPRSSF